jgi:bifunctional NMN adenylyltransferase/nudix hydrolase
VAIIRETVNGNDEILLARKPGEKGYRLIGGFVSPTDDDLQAAARREVLEETHVEISGLEYVGSYLVDDWRYRHEIDKIMTTVFVAHYMFGAIQPDDDIEELRWFPLNRGFDFDHLVPAHKPLLTSVLDAIERSSVKSLKEGAIHELPAKN